MEGGVSVSDAMWRKSFDLQEAAILLSVYLESRSKGERLTQAAETASIRLRALAASRGLSVSESFRSPQGLFNRLRSLAAIYEGKEIPSAPATAIFSEIVSLYRNNRAKYDEILAKASESCANIDDDETSILNEERSVVETVKPQPLDFFQWLQRKASSSDCAEIQRSYSMITTLMIKAKIINSPITEIRDKNRIIYASNRLKKAFANKRLRNTASRLIEYYRSYLGEIEVAQEEPVSEFEPELEQADEHQDNRVLFNFENSQQFERTKPVFCSLAGSVIEGRNWARILVSIIEREIAANNPAIPQLYEGSLIAEKKNRPFIMKDKIDGLNCSQLSNGYWVNVNYNIPRLMDIIGVLCLRCGYKKEDIILYGIPRDAVIRRNDSETISTEVSSGHDISIEAAEDFLRSAGITGATVNELISAVCPDAAIYPTMQALENSPNVITMPGKKYVLAECLVDLDEAEEVIGNILKTHFMQFEGYSNNQLLFGAATQELFLFLNDNDCENIDAVYAIARYLFEKKAVAGHPYKFSMPHIFEVEPDYPMTLRGLMIHLARNNGGILSAMDAKEFLQKTKLTYGGLGQLLQLGSANTFLIYDSDRYLLSETMGIDSKWCKQLHDRLDDLFRKANVAYVIPRDITSSWLSTLPLLPRGLDWTPLLLQEVIQKYPSVGFKAITANLNQSLDRLAAAFVPEGSPLQTFPDVVTLFMEEKHKGELPMRMTGEELRQELREAGMLENGEMIYALPKALDDYRFAWTDENKTVYVRGNK